MLIMIMIMMMVCPRLIRCGSLTLYHFARIVAREMGGEGQFGDFDYSLFLGGPE